MSRLDDFWYYSKGERIAICVLLIAITMLVVGRYGIRRTTPQAAAETDSIAATHTYNDTAAPLLAAFDPNTADSTALQRLGISARVARHVINYRKAGGHFDKPDDLLRIYGMDTLLYYTLKPYIRITPRTKLGRFRHDFKAAKRHDSLPERKRDTPTWTRDTTYYKYTEGTTVNLSKADTATLKHVPGIGSGIARMIVRYRERLGGFHDIQQLLEIQYVTEDMLRWFTLDSAGIRQIPINRATFKELYMHPYIDYHQAKAIMEYRDKYGKIENLSQLALYEEFAGKDFERILPYLSFE